MATTAPAKTEKAPKAPVAPVARILEQMKRAALQGKLKSDEIEQIIKLGDALKVFVSA